MDIKITPSKLIGTVNIPSSKSMTHRMLICAALANGQSKISNITFSKDIGNILRRSPREKQARRSQNF